MTPNGDVYITPDFRSAKAISDAGADIVALDCTARRLTAAEPWPELIRRIHSELNRPVLADIATLEDALAAERAGADAVATTLYGYTAETAGIRTVSWPLVQSIVARLTIPVLVEGHVTDPEEARTGPRHWAPPPWWWAPPSPAPKPSPPASHKLRGYRQDIKILLNQRRESV